MPKRTTVRNGIRYERIPPTNPPLQKAKLATVQIQNDYRNHRHRQSKPAARRVQTTMHRKLRPESKMNCCQNCFCKDCFIQNVTEISEQNATITNKLATVQIQNDYRNHRHRQSKPAARRLQARMHRKSEKELLSKSFLQLLLQPKCERNFRTKCHRN